MTATTFYSHIQNVDVLSASLIVQLQLEDLGSIVSGFKGKGRAGSVNDQEYAFQLCREDLEAWQSILKDQQMSLSILQAQYADQQIIKQTLREEETAISDRRLAAQLEGRHVPESGPSGTRDPVRPEPDIDPEYAAKLTALYHSEEAGAAFLQEAESPKGESSARGAREGSLKNRNNTRTCDICREDKKWFDLAGLPCDHEYCRECVDELFLTSVKDESLFPPRCCKQRIPFASVRVFLSSDTARSFEEKAPEFETPNRTYCHSTKCSAWIPPRNIESEIGTCPKCAMTTCTICKLASHGTGDCPRDEGTNQVLEMAAVNGWQRCYNCRRVVMMSLGCHHMVCRCRAEFCFNCGSRWKSCNCAHFDEHRLLARAEQIHGRRLQQPVHESPPAIEPVPDDEPVADDDLLDLGDPVTPEDIIVANDDDVPADDSTAVVLQAAENDENGLTTDGTSPASGAEEQEQEEEIRESPIAENDAEVADSEIERDDEQQQTTSSGVDIREEEPASRPEQEQLDLWPSDGPSNMGLDSLSLDLAELNVAQILEHLRKYHDCTHERWKYIPGRHRCEECYHSLPEFIFECRGCFTRACNRCRRNRL